MLNYRTKGHLSWAALYCCIVYPCELVKGQNSIHILGLQECRESKFWVWTYFKQINKQFLNPQSVWHTLKCAEHFYVDIIVLWHGQKLIYSCSVSKLAFVWKQGWQWLCFDVDLSGRFLSNRSQLKPCFHLMPGYSVHDWKLLLWPTYCTLRNMNNNTNSMTNLEP